MPMFCTMNNFFKDNNNMQCSIILSFFHKIKKILKRSSSKEAPLCFISVPSRQPPSRSRPHVRWVFPPLPTCTQPPRHTQKCAPIMLQASSDPFKLTHHGSSSRLTIAQCLGQETPGSRRRETPRYTAMYTHQELFKIQAALVAPPNSTATRRIFPLEGSTQAQPYLSLCEQARKRY